MLRDEIVETRGWVDADGSDEGLGLCEALPGPASSQMAIYLGWTQRGWRGGLVSGICFLLPGLMIVLGLSEIWRRGQTTPSFTSALQTLQPVIAAVIWAFAWKLMRTRRNRWQRITAGLVMGGVTAEHGGCLAAASGSVVGDGGIGAAVDQPIGFPTRNHRCSVLPLTALPRTGRCTPFRADGTTAVGNRSLGFSASELIDQLFWLFFKTGLLVFGGGLVIIPLLEAQVLKLGWLSSSQFLDGVAIGQISPGPVVLTSAFVGYQAGWQHGGYSLALVSAAVATAGIFLPSFVLILVATPVLQRLRQNSGSNGFCVDCWPVCLAPLLLLPFH